MQKLNVFYQRIDIDMLKLCCTLPNLVNNCLHKHTNMKLYPLTELEELFEKKGMMLSVVLLSLSVAKQLLMKLSFQSLQTCKSIVVIDASQLYPYLMCQPALNGLFTRWNLDPNTKRYTPRQNKKSSFENMVMSFFQRTRLGCKIETFFTTGRQKKIDCFSVDGFCSPCNTVIETMGCFATFVAIRNFEVLSLKVIFNMVVNRERLVSHSKALYFKKASLSFKCGSVNGGDRKRQVLTSKTYPRKLSLQMFNCSWATNRRNKKRKLTWLLSMRLWSTRNLASQTCNLLLNLQDHLN